MLKSGANLLLLDEPTNDLDVDTLRALEEALEDFAGCAVIISHDRWFLDRIATHILAFEGDSHVEWFEGNFQDYEADKMRRLGTEFNHPAPDEVQEVRAMMIRRDQLHFRKAKARPGKDRTGPKNEAPEPRGEGAILQFRGKAPLGVRSPVPSFKVESKNTRTRPAVSAAPTHRSSRHLAAGRRFPGSRDQCDAMAQSS